EAWLAERDDEKVGRETTVTAVAVRIRMDPNQAVMKAGCKLVRWVGAVIHLIGGNRQPADAVPLRCAMDERRYSSPSCGTFRPISRHGRTCACAGCLAQSRKGCHACAQTPIPRLRGCSPAPPR